MTKPLINSKEEKPVSGQLLSDGAISIRIERDTNKIKEVIFEDDLSGYLLQDSGKLAEEIRKYKNKNHFAYIMNEEGKDFGIVTLEYLNRLKTGVIECGVLKDYRGLKAKKAIQLILKHIYKKNPNIKLIARMEKENRHSYFFSKLFGFKLKNENETHYIVMR